MGEISDSIINGDFDYLTGEYLGEGDGFPRTAERGYRKKKVNAYGGVVNFCMMHGRKQSGANKAIKRYSKEQFGIASPTANGNEFSTIMYPFLLETCKKIQKDFEAFKEWFHENYGYNHNK